MSTTSSVRPKFIFDANFFISLKEIRARSPYINLAKAKDELDMDFFVSGAVFNECPFIVGSDFQEFSKGVAIELVKDDELSNVKKDLKGKGVRLMAQDPDLTLVALASRLRNQDDKNDVFIVSDDFKLSQNIETLAYRVKCLPLPSFLQIVANNLSSRQARYWKAIRKKVLKLNLDYMLSRKEIYPPQAKIAWLIENAVDVAGEGVHLRKNVDPEAQQKEKLSEEAELFEICQKYIINPRLPKNKLKRLKPFESSLIEVRKSRKLLKNAKSYLMESEFKSALKYLSKAKNTLNETLQIHGAGKMAENEYQFLEKVLASEISKISFLRAFVFIEADKVARAINYLDDTALFSTISRIPETVLTINYLKALLYVFNGIYGRSVEHFEFIQKLAESYGNTTLKFKSTIGQTIILYLTDQKEKALEKVKETVKNLNKDDFDYLLDALIDSGDYFLAMGFPEVSTNLYMKSLELAIDADKVWKSDLILNKMKNSFMASALVGTEKRQTHQIAGLIEEWHELEGVEKYNELMTNFTEFTNKLYEPFEFFTKKEKKHTTYYDLPDEMKHEWKCVKIYENEHDSKTLLIGFKEEIGLVGFKVVSGRIFESVPENYTITLKKSAKVEIVPPKPGKIEHLLCRAIVVVPEENRDLKISRKIPVFFEQLRI